jgi:hypothetical protein
MESKRAANSKVVQMVIRPVLKEAKRKRPPKQPVIMPLFAPTAKSSFARNPTRKLVAGVDLNHRPLGYESNINSIFNNLQDAGGP